MALGSRPNGRLRAPERFALRVRVGARERLAVCGFRHSLLCSARFDMSSTLAAVSLRVHPVRAPSRAARRAPGRARALRCRAESDARASAPAARPSTRDSRDEDSDALTAETSPDTASASTTASTAADEDAPDLSIPASTAENSMRSAVKLRPVLGRLALCRNDPSLAPYEHLLWDRYQRYEGRFREIETNEGSLTAFADSYETFGVHPDPDGVPGDVRYVEYAPGAARLCLTGDFNDWARWEHVGEVDEFGRWTVRVPASAGLRHGAHVRVVMETPDGRVIDRIPAWIRAVAPSPDEGATHHDGVYHDPPPGERHAWAHPKPAEKPRSLRIYEAHVGMSSEEHRHGTYREFADQHLERVADMGYNALQLMAIADHSYYACFGYQVTNFFAPARRSGSPEDLKYLVDKAHGLGMHVFMDVVHAHASDNVIDGLNEFDGTPGHYFHDDPGLAWHALWGTRMFDYGKYETLRFLLSNLRYWSEEFRFDGFRFDGVTAMLYTHRGVHWDFLGGQSEFYGHHADVDACVYLMLANHMLRDGPRGETVTTIAEDVSGQTGACRPVWHGGLGFNLRLSMGPPDKWSALAAEPDFNWTPSRVADICTARSPEPAVAYLESHDQCLVGDKTFAFRLMDGAMYECMGKTRDEAPHPAVERGVALHKMARLLTLGMGGEAWLTFMGNEFGHPEWVDFPREGNGESFQHARRQWSLRDPDAQNYYSDLERFDAALMRADETLGLLASNRVEHKHPHHVQDDTGVLAFHCGGALVVANLHPHESYPAYRVGSAVAGRFRLELDTDAAEFGGWGRLDPDTEVVTEGGSCDWQGTGVTLYLPSRSAQVYALVDEWDVPEDEWGTHHDADFGSYGDDEYDTGGGGDDAVWF